MHYAKRKNPIPKGYILYDSADKTFWKSQNLRNGEQVARGWGGFDYKGTT